MEQQHSQWEEIRSIFNSYVKLPGWMLLKPFTMFARSDDILALHLPHLHGQPYMDTIPHKTY